MPGRHLLLAILLFTFCCNNSGVPEMAVRVHDRTRKIDLHSHFLLQQLTDNIGHETKKESIAAVIAKWGRVDAVFLSLALPAHSKITNPLMHIQNLVTGLKKIPGLPQSSLYLSKSFADIINERDNKTILMLSLESPGIMKGNPLLLEKIYQMGIRMITIVHNTDNPFARSCFTEKDTGLSPAGRTLVRLMQKKGMIIDVSHASKKTIDDIFTLTGGRYPLVASHSCAYKVNPHPRNLTDTQIIMIKNTGGLIGISFHSYFLGKAGKAAVDDIFNHIDHIISIAGDDTIAIGTDFGGIRHPVGMENYSKLVQLTDIMLKNGYTIERIEKIYCKNILRLINKFITLH